MLTAPLTDLPRVGPVQSKRFASLGIRTLRDLLFYFPFRYEDWRTQIAVSDCKPGELAYIKGTVVKMTVSKLRGWRQLTEAVIEDERGGGTIKAIWFHQPYLAQSLREGTRVAMCGKVQLSKYGVHFTNPEHEVLFSDSYRQIHTGRLVPVYSVTAGITPKWIRLLVSQALARLTERDLFDVLPEEFTAQYDLLDLHTSLRQIHFPENAAELRAAKRRLAFDELFFTQAGVKLHKARRAQDHAAALAIDHARLARFVAKLPFTLTGAQQRAIAAITDDLAQPHPMNRLLEGDVGSGKTVVALAALLACVSGRRRGLLMAPTEILALQHYEKICALLAKSGEHIRVGLLTHAYQRTSAPGEGEPDILVGTHALLFSDAPLDRLGLVVVDEQHRFGVKQRNALTKKSTSGADAALPHFLSMTATPIPRTLALTMYGDLDISVLDEAPSHKKPIITRLVRARDRAREYTFVDEQIAAGRQVFVVCPLIEKSDSEDLKATSVEEEFARLSREIFPHRRVAALHGALKPEEKQQIIAGFAAGNTDILVSTSVIEVGIDIPNASVMLIESAERFGLAQLHQFRGRVGRGSAQSYCLLLPGGAGSRVGSKTRERLQALVDSTDGFALAQIDLELRGAGQLYGFQQSGIPEFKLANFSDPAFIELTSRAADDAIAQLDRWPTLRRAIERAQKDIHFE